MDHIIDWTSVKLCGISVFLTVITWNQVMGFLSIIAVVSTIAYNAIRIYKELKKKKND
jgi:energy-converting hydrogenase Eha subunit E